MTKTLKLLAVFAHPDDESMGMGGTLAKYSAEGVETYLVCATRGERGWFGDEGSNPGFERIAQIRAKELEAAGKILGLKEIHFLDYIDGDLDRADPMEAIGKIAAHIRRIEPQVIVTFPPDGNYGHPDHIAISQFTHAAVVCAADAGYSDSLGLPPRRVSKFYYMVDTEEFVNFILPHVGEIVHEVDGRQRNEVAWREWSVTTRVDVASRWKTAWDAILCHQSQLPSIAPLLGLSKDEVRRLLALQGAFYRVFSFVNGGRKVETDLFEGLR